MAIGSAMRIEIAGHPTNGRDVRAMGRLVLDPASSVLVVREVRDPRDGKAGAEPASRWSHEKTPLATGRNTSSRVQAGAPTATRMANRITAAANPR